MDTSTTQIADLAARRRATSRTCCTPSRTASNLLSSPISWRTRRSISRSGRASVYSGGGIILTPQAVSSLSSDLPVHDGPASSQILVVRGSVRSVRRRRRPTSRPDGQPTPSGAPDAAQDEQLRLSDSGRAGSHHLPRHLGPRARQAVAPDEGALCTNVTQAVLQNRSRLSIPS